MTKKIVSESMALKFNCPNCNEDIVTRYLSVGEVAECKKCRGGVVIPQDAITFSDDEAEVEIKSPSSPSERKRLR